MITFSYYGSFQSLFCAGNDLQWFPENTICASRWEFSQSYEMGWLCSAEDRLSPGRRGTYINQIPKGRRCRTHEQALNVCSIVQEPSPCWKTIQKNWQEVEFFDTIIHFIDFCLHEIQSIKAYVETSSLSNFYQSHWSSQDRSQTLVI